MHGKTELYTRRRGPQGSFGVPKTAKMAYNQNGQKWGKRASFCIYHGRIRKMFLGIFYADRVSFSTSGYE